MGVLDFMVVKYCERFEGSQTKQCQADNKHNFCDVLYIND